MSFYVQTREAVIGHVHVRKYNDWVLSGKRGRSCAQSLYLPSGSIVIKLIVLSHSKAR